MTQLSHVSFKVTNGEIFPVSGCEFTVLVAGDKEDGVVGLQGSNIVCFTCEHQADNCEHVAKLIGEQGWRSGESARLPPMCPGFDSRTRHMWAEFVGSLLCSERFFSGYSGFPLSPKTSI